MGKNQKLNPSNSMVCECGHEFFIGFQGNVYKVFAVCDECGREVSGRIGGDTADARRSRSSWSAQWQKVKKTDE